MERNEVKERWKDTAEIFLRDKIKTFIKTLGDDFYFGYVVFVGEETITIDCFAPTKRKGQRHILYWNLIKEFDKYNNKEDEYGRGI